jgi:hypothetical protein
LTISQAQHVSVSAGEVLQAIDGPMRALADAVGVAVGDELRPRKRVSMTRHSAWCTTAIAKRCGTDAAAFRLVDDEVGVSSGTVLAGRECIVQLQQPFGESVLEGRGAGRRALAARAALRQACSRLANEHNSRKSQEAVLMAEDELVILSRCFDLLTWLVPKSESFPKVHRHSVVQRMLDSALDFQELLFSARKGDGCRTSTTAAGCRWPARSVAPLPASSHTTGHWLNDGQYEHVSRQVAELGRLLGGWMKQERSTHELGRHDSGRRNTPG